MPTIIPIYTCDEQQIATITEVLDNTSVPIDTQVVVDESVITEIIIPSQV